MAGIELVDPQGTLLQEIGDSRMKREDVALTYALALASTDVDWSVINHAILDRWSMNALKWIKERAWKLARERAAVESP